MTTSPDTISHPPSHRRAGRFERLAGWSYRHRRRALALWVTVLIGVSVAAATVGGDYRNDFSLPGTESQRTVDTLTEHAPAQAGDTIEIVLHAPGGVRAAQIRGRVGAVLDDVRKLPHVADVRSPYADSAAVSRDGTIAYATVILDGTADKVPPADVLRIVDSAQAAEGEGLQVELSGTAVRDADAGASGAAETAGLLAALVILVLLFGSILAASLPLITAIFAVGGTIALITLASHLTVVPDYASAVMILVGLGVGIDYALLIFSRYRAELLDGSEREAAQRAALDTAGRSVLFAGCTVIIALLGLLALGLGALKGIALGVALTVLVTMIASLTLLPALLAITGKRIERSVRRRAARARRADGERWRRWATFVQRHPWPALAIAIPALLVLSFPALDMRLGFADAANDPPSSTTRQGYDLLAEGFGPGFNGPLIVVAEGADGRATTMLRQTLQKTPGVALATPPSPSPDREVATIVVFPDSSPQDAATNELVERLRDHVLPPLAKGTGATFLVGGATAASDDFAGAVGSRLPAFVALVIGLSTLLLVIVFRSLLIPFKAAVLNLLSIGASLGAIKLVFQEGMFGVQPGPIEAFIPVLIFAIVFGLSMDYEVFLVSRMQEEWHRTGDARIAVREGLATTGRVITAAAAIMIVVFGAFILSPERMLQQFGLGLAVAIFLDVLVIRCLIVPAVMRVLGERAWWLPAPLRRHLPRVSLEGGPATPKERS
ncbi:MMPL family transporter [Actinomadura sp. HBU206391]|uniref:MMPL family transporter n=1 Tax=Actinomadura sp. HBU206391 TaxID=2731692 RepID=UPI0016508A40|nr:MMPL family transporter [Actinomadura sp. HBU206391]MBC6456959.1 MMPL family transporter [Actinomadura sp. HBU206391]